jgi:hypothetical protein
MADCLNCHQPMPDAATVCPRCGADVEKIRSMLAPRDALSTPRRQAPATTGMAQADSLRKLVILVLLVTAGIGGFFYVRAQKAGFDINKYKELVTKLQQGMPLLRQTVNAPAGDLLESFQGTPAGELLKVDQKFFQDLAPILSKGVADCKSAPGEIESLRQQYQQTREPLARGVGLSQMNPLLGLAFIQFVADQMKALEPILESFVASCPRESKALNFLLEKNK